MTSGHHPAAENGELHVIGTENELLSCALRGHRVTVGVEVDPGMSFSRYRVPRFRDVPRIEVVLLDRPDLQSVGAGETPIIAVAPATANALAAPTGARFRSLPLRHEKYRAAGARA